MWYDIQFEHAMIGDVSKALEEQIDSEVIASSDGRIIMSVYEEVDERKIQDIVWQFNGGAQVTVYERNEAWMDARELI